MHFSIVGHRGRAEITSGCIHKEWQDASAKTCGYGGL